MNYDLVRELFDYRDGKLYWKVKTAKKIRIGDEAGVVSKDTGYRLIRYKDVLYQRSRLVWLYHYGYLPENYIDHINRIRHDDRLENLRHVSAQCNARNTHTPSTNTSGVKGVTFDKKNNKWRAYLTVNLKRKMLGRYDDFDDAVLARLAGEQCLGWAGCDSDSPAYRYCIENGLIKV